MVAMPPEFPQGKTLLKWRMPEYPAHERGVSWYVVMSIIGLVLLIYAFITTNYLFAIIILIFAIIIALTSMRKPEILEVRITETGVGFGENFFPYRDIDRFSVVYQPPEVQNVYLEFKAGLRPRLALTLGDENPVKVRELLREHLKEDVERTEEPLTDFFARIFKL